MNGMTIHIDEMRIKINEIALQINGTTIQIDEITIKINETA